MAILNIDGVDLPAPSSFKSPDFDLDSDDTNRNEEGVLQRDRVRQGIYKIELEWNGITSAQLATIKSALQPASFEVVFPSENGYITKTMYAGDRNVEMVKYNEDYSEIRWNLSCNLTEY